MELGLKPRKAMKYDTKDVKWRPIFTIFIEVCPANNIRIGTKKKNQVIESELGPLNKKLGNIINLGNLYI
jgi:hypothetical protein